MSRIQIAEEAPSGYRKVNTLDAYVEEALETDLKNFIYLRASLINGCTYCVDAHSVELQNAGVPLRKIFSVTTWRESEFFSGRERAAFELTEEITRISDGGVPDDVWERAAGVFEPKELADIVVAIGTINIWNRIAISTRMLPPTLTD